MIRLALLGGSRSGNGRGRIIRVGGHNALLIRITIVDQGHFDVGRQGLELRLDHASTRGSRASTLELGRRRCWCSRLLIRIETIGPCHDCSRIDGQERLLLLLLSLLLWRLIHLLSRSGQGLRVRRDLWRSRRSGCGIGSNGHTTRQLESKTAIGQRLVEKAVQWQKGPSCFHRLADYAMTKEVSPPSWLFPKNVVMWNME
jgi:hypothetical protein